jgi:hypothetical protein
MTIKVCHEKFTKRLEKVCYVTGWAIFYMAQFGLPILLAFGLHTIEGSGYEPDVYDGTFSQYLDGVMMTIFGFIGTAGIYLFAFMFGSSWIQQVNRKIKLIGWNEDC